MLETIFTVNNADLERLNPDEAVEIFSELLWAESRRLGIAVTKINISSKINVPDGGIDATVDKAINISENEVIKSGLNCFQIKAGESFEPWQDSEIRKELFGHNPIEKNNLGSRITNCLENDGTYVLVCFKKDLTDEQKGRAVTGFQEYFIKCGYTNPKVDVWSQNNLISFLTIFPSLALKVNRKGLSRFQTHKSWSQDAEMQRVFKAGQLQMDIINKIKDELTKNDRAIHIRILGEPGIGKTRLVLEGTREPHLQPLVIYCDAASKFRDSDLLNEILKDDNRFNTILVVDECDPDSRSYIWNKFKSIGPRIKLISLYNEYDETSGNICHINTLPLEETQISDIIQEYGIPKDQANRWSELCSGSPRVAHVFGQNLKYNPEDLLKSPDTINVWDRYIVGYENPNSADVIQRQLVIRHLALFKRFGFGKQVIKEAQAIAKMIGKADPNITWPRFKEIVHNLKASKILQGETTLYITPKALHIKLWIDYWNIYGTGINFEKFIEVIPDSLHEWFYDMFKYASESQIATDMVKDILGEKGPFITNNFFLKTKEGGRFFTVLAEANPESALLCLKKTIGSYSKNELKEFTTGRREIVWSLEKIAMWKNLFSDAAILLLSLAEAENESYSNNSSGVFSSLFSPAPGLVAPTEASPQDRFPILKHAIESSSKEKRIIAMKACDIALQTRNFTRSIGAENQGLRNRPKLWTPNTYGEIFDYYKEVWQLLLAKIDCFPIDEKDLAINILLNNSRGLARIQNLSDMIIKTLNELAENKYFDKKKILEKVIHILHYEGKNMDKQNRDKWEKLRDSVSGNDYPALMKRYVGMDLIEDKFDNSGNRIDITDKRVEELAKTSIENKKLFLKELNWLTTIEAQNGFKFGYNIGKLDINFSLLPDLLLSQKNITENASAFFLSGYFAAIFNLDINTWEKELETISVDEKLCFYIPELTWRSGMSDQAALRILKLAQKNIVSVKDFRMFGYGSVLSNVSENIFQEWINFLLNSNQFIGLSIALELFQFYYLRKEIKLEFPLEITKKLLTHNQWFTKTAERRQDQMISYHWSEIGKEFVKRFPSHSFDLGIMMLNSFGEDGTIFESFHSETHVVLNKIIQIYPDEMWKEVTKLLGPPFDTRAFNISQWLRGGEFYEIKNGALTLFSETSIWKWVDDDVKMRAKYIASFVPNELFSRLEKICFAREVLVRYGNRNDVRENLISNFSTEGWSGLASHHYQEKKQYLLKYKEEEENMYVKSWIDEYISLLDLEIENSKTQEERDYF
jgi:hypothetical protein